MIPEVELARDRIQLATLLKIEQTYGCSRKALLMRLLKMKLISQGYYDQNCVNILSLAKQYGYPTTLYKPSNEHTIIGPYASLANKLFNEDKISEGHYRELLGAIGIDINEILTDEEYRSE